MVQFEWKCVIWVDNFELNFQYEKLWFFIIILVDSSSIESIKRYLSSLKKCIKWKINKRNSSFWLFKLVWRLSWAWDWHLWRLVEKFCFGESLFEKKWKTKKVGFRVVCGNKKKDNQCNDVSDLLSVAVTKNCWSWDLLDL